MWTTFGAALCFVARPSSALTCYGEKLDSALRRFQCLCSRRASRLACSAYALHFREQLLRHRLIAACLLATNLAPQQLASCLKVCSVLKEHKAEGTTAALTDLRQHPLTWRTRIRLLDVLSLQIILPWLLLLGPSLQMRRGCRRRTVARSVTLLQRPRCSKSSNYVSNSCGSIRSGNSSCENSSCESSS